MNLRAVADSLVAHESVSFTAHGNSMAGRVASGTRVTVEPLASEPKRGDIVLAKVRGRWYLHLVSAVKGNSVQISNNKGHVNGWTSRRNVVGRLVE